MVAPSEQVAATVERLAKHSLEARREALSLVGDGRLSLSPESNRATARPAAPEAEVAVIVPPLGGVSGEGVFATQEAPTKPRRKLTPVSSPAVEGLSAKETPRIGSTQTPATPKADATRPGLSSRESTSSGVSVLDEEPPVRTASSSLRRFAPLVVVGLGVVAIVAAVALRSGGSDPATTPEATPTTSTRRAALPTSSPPPTESAAVPAPAPSADVTPSAEPSAEPPAPSATAKPAKPRDERPAPAPASTGGFRPKGI
jgi:hypothetical protein